MLPRGGEAWLVMRDADVRTVLADPRLRRTVPVGADLVAHLSMPLPVTIICELVGVPVGDRANVRGVADAALSTSAMSPSSRSHAAR